MLATSQLPIQTTKIFYGFFDVNLCPWWQCQISCKATCCVTESNCRILDVETESPIWLSPNRHWNL